MADVVGGAVPGWRALPELTEQPEPRLAPATRRLHWARVAAGDVRVLVLACTAVLMVTAYLTEYPLVLGRWEDQTTFPMLLSAGQAPVSFELYQSGDVGGDHYALLSLGYYTAQLFGWDFVAFRLPAILSGLAAIGTFFALSARWYGFWPGLLAAIALASNPTFFLFSHQLIVPVVSVLFVLLVIERYQLIERSRHLFWVVPTGAFAFTFLLQQYAVGRLYGCALLAYWIAWLVGSSIRARRRGLPLNRAALLALPVFVVLVGLFSVLLDGRNLHLLTPQLVFPPDGEYFLPGPRMSLLRDNLAVELNAVVPLLPLVPGRLGQFSSDLVVDIRTYVLTIAMLPLVLLGAGVTVVQVRRRSSARLTLFLLAVMFTGPLFSANVGGHLTISSFRMFFLVIPLYLLAGAGIAWLLVRSAPVARLAGLSAVLLLLGAQIAGTVSEVNRDRAFLDDLARRWTPSSELTLFGVTGAARATSDFELATNGSYHYYFEEAAPLAAAVNIVDRAPAWSTGPNDVVLVRLIGRVQPGSSGGPTRLVLYLRSLGATAALYEPSNGSLQGAGVVQRSFPTYVVAASADAAEAAAGQLTRAGLIVRTVDFEWPPTKPVTDCGQNGARAQGAPNAYATDPRGTQGQTHPQYDPSLATLADRDAFRASLPPGTDMSVINDAIARGCSANWLRDHLDSLSTTNLP